jgi:molybdate transport system substrate-binding protein
VSAQHPKEAKQLLDYLASPQVQAQVKATGLDPVAAH